MKDNKTDEKYKNKLVEQYNKLMQDVYLEDNTKYMKDAENIVNHYIEVAEYAHIETLEEYICFLKLEDESIVDSLKERLQYIISFSEDTYTLEHTLKLMNTFFKAFKITTLTKPYIIIYAEILLKIGEEKAAEDIVKYFLSKDKSFAEGYIFLAINKKEVQLSKLEENLKNTLELEEKIKLVSCIIKLAKIEGKNISKYIKMQDEIYNKISKEKRPANWHRQCKEEKSFAEILDKLDIKSRIEKHIKNDEKRVDLGLVEKAEIILEDSTLAYLEKCKEADEKLIIKEKYMLEISNIEEGINKAEIKAKKEEKKGYIMNSIEIYLDIIKYISENKVCILNENIDEIIEKNVYYITEVLKTNKITYEKQKEIIEKYKCLIDNKKIDIEMRYKYIESIIKFIDKKDAANIEYLSKKIEEFKAKEKGKTNTFYEAEFDYLLKFKSANVLLDTVRNDRVIRSIKLLNKVLDMYMLMEQFKEMDIVIYYAEKYADKISDEEYKVEYLKNLIIYKKFLAKSVMEIQRYKDALKQEIILVPSITRIEEYEALIDAKQWKEVFKSMLAKMNIKEIYNRKMSASYNQLVKYLCSKKYYDELLDVLKIDILSLEEYEKVLPLKYKKEIKLIYAKYLKNAKQVTAYSKEIYIRISERENKLK
ncbi:MAG: hypothetical protein RR922_03345 [Clostridia bacterium]